MAAKPKRPTGTKEMKSDGMSPPMKRPVPRSPQDRPKGRMGKYAMAHESMEAGMKAMKKGRPF